MVAKTFVVLTLLADSAWAQEEYVGARERAWQAGLSGDVRADNVVVGGSEIDYEDDIDLGSPEFFHDITLWVKLPLLPIRGNIGGWMGGFEEDVTLSRTIVFGDQVFLATTTVNAKADFRCLYLNGEFVMPIPGLPGIDLSIGVTGGLKYAWARVEITNDSSGTQEAEEVEGAFPAIGIHAIASITSFVRVELEINGLAGDYGPLSGRFYDAAIEADFRPMKNLFIGIGYRMIHAKLETRADPETAADLTLQGPFFSVGLEF